MKKILFILLTLFSVINLKAATTLPFNVDTVDIKKNIKIGSSVILLDTSLRHSNTFLVVDSATGKLKAISASALANPIDSVLYLDSTEVMYYVVLSSTNTPPGSPIIGATYLVGNSPTGAFAGHAKDIAEWNGSSWDFTDAAQGEYLYNSANALTYQFRSGNWVQTAGIPILNNGNSISAGVTIGTNNAKSLNFETNNIKRGRLDSIGIWHFYNIPTAEQIIKIDTFPTVVKSDKIRDTLVNQILEGDGSFICYGDTTGLKNQIKLYDNNFWTVDTLQYPSCHAGPTYSLIQFRFANPKIPSGYYSDTALVLFRNFRTTGTLTEGFSPITFITNGTNFYPSFDNNNGAGYINGPYPTEEGDTLGIAGFTLDNITNVDTIWLNILVPNTMDIQLEINQVGILYYLEPIAVPLGIVGDKIYKMQPIKFPAIGNGLRKENDTLKFGSDDLGNGILTEPTTLNQISFPLSFLYQSPYSSRFTSFGNRQGTFFVSNKFSSSVSELGKTNLFINDNGFSVLTTDDDNSFDKNVSLTQDDTMFNINAQSLGDSHKNFLIKRDIIKLVGGMSSGGTELQVNDRRINFMHWRDNGMGGNDTFNYTFPDTIGLSGQVLKTDGINNLYWDNSSSSSSNAYDSTYQLDDTTFVLKKTSTGQEDTILYRLNYPTLYNSNGFIKTPRTVYTSSPFFIGTQTSYGSYISLDSASHFSAIYSEINGFHSHGIFNYSVYGKPVTSIGLNGNAIAENGLFIEKDTLWMGIKDLNAAYNDKFLMTKHTADVFKLGLKKNNQNNFVVDMSDDIPKISIGNSSTYTKARATLDVQTDDAIIVPVGNTGARPTSPVQGMIRFNTTTNKFEGYDGSTWVDFH